MIASQDPARLFSTALVTKKGHQGAINSVDFSIDGKRLLTTGADKTARVWDLENAGESIRRLERFGDRCLVARFSSDGQLIAAAGSSVRLWDAATGRLVRELSPGDTSRVDSVAFSPTDNRLLAVGYGGRSDDFSCCGSGTLMQERNVRRWPERPSCPASWWANTPGRSVHWRFRPMVSIWSPVSAQEFSTTRSILPRL